MEGIPNPVDMVSGADRERVERLLAPTGRTLWVEREADLDAVTALSGSGPAYVFYFAEAMMAVVLMDHALRHRAQNADVQVATPKIAAQAPAEVAAKFVRPVLPVDDPEPDEA